MIICKKRVMNVFKMAKLYEEYGMHDFTQFKKVIRLIIHSNVLITWLFLKRNNIL